MNNGDISRLITIPKCVKGSVKQNSEPKRGANQWTFNAIALGDPAIKYRIFLRQLIKFPENFSIGLEYLSQTSEDIKLIRFNGPSHFHCNHVRNQDCFSDFHIHIATEEAIQAGLKTEDFAYPTTLYSTFEEALNVFWDHVCLQDDRLKYFPFLNKVSQLSLNLSSHTQ